MAAPSGTDLLQPPARLHGREAEAAALRQALAEGRARVLVTCGPAGAGKTALMRQVLAEARERGAVTGTGKHVQGLGTRDLEPLICALEEALSAGLDQLFDPAAGLDDLRRALGDSGPVLGALGGGVLRTLSGAQASGPVTAERADERLIEAVIRALRWLEGFGAPVLLLIDDWGRAGPQARRLYGRILTASVLPLTRILATERDEEPFGAAAAPTTRVDVGALSAEAQLAIARDLLGARAAAAGEVLAFLGPAAATPFDLIGSIRILAAAALRREQGRWRLDLEHARRALAGAAAPALVRQAEATSGFAMDLARSLAVYGDDAELDDLIAGAGLERSIAEAAVRDLVGLGLLRQQGGRVEYPHDRLRAAVLDRMDADARRRLAGQLAEALRAAGVAPGQGGRGMTMLSRRIEAGLDVDDPAGWRDAFAAGAFAARQIGDRAAAEAFVEAGLTVAGRGGATYPLLTEAASAAISRGDHAEACRLTDAARRLAASPAERAAADEMRVFARRVSGDLDAAIEVASEVLARVGVALPRRVTAFNLARAVARVFSLDPHKAVAPLAAARLEVEAPMIRAMNGIGSLLFERNPLLVVVMVTRFLSTPVIYGTAAGAGTLALLCCAFGDYRRAAAWAAAADRLQAPDQPLRGIAKQYSTNFGHVFVRPRPETRSRGEAMAALAYAEGDLAVVLYGNRDRLLDSVFSDDPLSASACLGDEAVRMAERLSDTPTIPHVRALRQMIEQLQAGGPEGWRLDGEHFDHAASFRAMQSEGLTNTARGVAALEAMLAVAFGAYGRAAALAERAWPSFGAAPFQAQTQIWTFATGLALYRTGRRPSALGLWNLRRLARLNPNDFLHRWRLLEAEALRTRGRRRRALAAYAAAVEASRASRCLLECGIVAAAAAEGAETLGALDQAERWRSLSLAAWRGLGAEGVLEARFGRPRPLASSELRAQLATLEAQHAARAVELDAAREAAERANRAKSRLLAAVGHELRTPLQGALGLVELAEGGGDALELETLRAALAHLGGVVGDLTDLGALEGEVLSVAAAPFDASAATASVAALHQAAARAAGRELTLAGTDAPIWIEGDEGRVRQVLSNLLANALRHGQGRIGLEVRRDPATERIAFGVSDDGPPLRDAELLKIFEPFDRAGREQGDGGLGLGLFLGRHLARAMGGDLRVVMRPDGGKTFEFEIAGPTVAAPAADTAAYGGLAGLRVLLAEDTALSRRVLAELLRREGCQVVAAEDGAAALAALADGVFDLLLLDQRMPGASGIEVARAAAKQAGPPRCVLMTANRDEGLERQAQAAGVETVLLKPVSVAALRALAPMAADPAGGGASRVAELRRLLGPAADGLLREVRPAVSQEVEALEAVLSGGDPADVDAQLHRLRGLARHFGLETLLAALEAPAAGGAEMLARVRDGAAATDWSAFEPG